MDENETSKQGSALGFNGGVNVLNIMEILLKSSFFHRRLQNIVHVSVL